MISLCSKYYSRVVANFWGQTFSVVSLGVLSALYFGSIGLAWAVTGEFTRWGGHFLQLIGLDTSQYTYLKLINFTGTPLSRIDGVMVMGMFIGAFISALFGQNVKLRVPSGRRILQALIGGIIAGFGTRLAMGCNLAALFTGIPQFSFHTWLFTLGTIFGTYYGLKLSMRPWMMGTPKLVSVKTVENTIENQWYYRIQPYIGVTGLIIFIYYLLQKVNANYALNLLLATCFGFGFGFLIQKGQICFTSAFRDLWLIGRSTMTKALVWGMVVQTIITAVFLANGMPPKVIWWAGPGALLGGILFGLGIVIAGGCETGWMYRSVEGQIQFWFVGLGNVIGATILILAWDSGVYTWLVEPFPKINLVTNFGYVGAILLTMTMLLSLYIWADWREVSKKGILVRRPAREQAK
ncbi:selenium metabolism membrane protein YedE/FdhT [Pelosinus sp. IPA-1]|uniref:selenium metabolism membrane protein YedE/FdhT n=1 Tax=Pelosinus sp. IPA-1 TaxID=3029569 RepID=UPI00243626F7|nr:selenium metabolism membrane protein YedE/FdhT [Pelosinus sp. IPA-1]GMB00570.1 hypothetical protein PIPA1_33690 [Pelosinus sp. IPA-1]